MYIQCLHGQKQELKNQYKMYNEKGKNLDAGNCLGYIDIPKINVYLPIYEGTSDKVLLQGIGHLKNTSLPIGGKNTNSVLVGHTGITAKTFFDDLVDMELGDEFNICILDDVLKYKVIDIKVVLPDNTEDIKLVAGTDLVTLVTCTPKYVNSHRLLVIGERFELKQVDENELSKTKVISVIQGYNLFLIYIIVIVGIFIVINRIHNKDN